MNCLEWETRVALHAGGDLSKRAIVYGVSEKVRAAHEDGCLCVLARHGYGGIGSVGLSG